MKRVVTLVALMALLVSATPQAQQRDPRVIISDIKTLLDELERSIPKTVSVTTSAELQTAANLAQDGQEIVLQAGATYVGPITLPAHAGVVKIRSSATLPNRRIGPADAALLPTITAPNADGALRIIGTSGWVIDGVRLGSVPGGFSDVVVIEGSDNIYLDRLLLVAGPDGQKRGVRGNGTNVTLTRSYIGNIWRSGQDSQAFCAWSGAGPFIITDNFLEAGSENIMFGGSDNAGVQYNPSDILIEGNLLSKNLAWKGKTGFAVKNLLELKNATRVTIRNNILEHNWIDAQNGYGIVLKVANQDGRAPWSVTQDVLLENNILRDTANGINILGTDYQYPSGTLTNLMIRRNLVQTDGVAIQINGGKNIAFDHNTFENGWSFMSMYGLVVQGLVVTNNLANHNDYGVKGDGTGIGIVALNAFASPWTFSQNVLLNRVPGRGGSYPADNWFNLADVPAGISVGR